MTEESVPVPAPAPVAPEPEPVTVEPEGTAPAPIPAPAWTDTAQYPEPQYAPPPFLAPPDPVAEARRKRRRRNTLRWTGAVVLAAAVGAGSAFAVIHPERTDIPGLATAADGRYVFPALSLPTLQPGEPVPGDTANNPGGRHLADIRKLLLPAPQGAVLDKQLPGATGWLPESSLTALANAGMAQELYEYGLRHTAAVGWKTPDGAKTSVYLLQFPDMEAAQAAGTDFGSSLNAVTAPGTAASKTFTPAGTSVAVTYYTITTGGTRTQYGYFSDGDTEAVIIFSAPASVSIAPFEQELQLQAELLQ